MLRWRVDGADDIVLPGFSGSERADELWRKTCFELFLGDRGGRYREFNFSPSGQWAAYEFASYRNRAGNHELAEPPSMKAEKGPSILSARVLLPVRTLDGARSAGLSAVIEETGGHLSYWALVHRREKPDFHDPACFAVAFASPQKA